MSGWRSGARNLHMVASWLPDPERRLPDIRLRHFGFICQDFKPLSALWGRA